MGVTELGDETGVGVMSHPIKLENMCPAGRGQGSHARPDGLILVFPLPHCRDVGEVTDPGVPEVTGPGVPEVPEVTGPGVPGVPEVTAPGVPGVPEVTAPGVPGVPEDAGPGVPATVHSDPKSGHATPEKYTPRTVAKITEQHTTTISIITLVFIDILKYLNYTSNFVYK